MKVKLLIIGIVSMFFCSCSSIKHTSATADVDVKIINFTVADVTVDPARATMTYSWDFNPFKRQDISLIKTNVTAQLLQNTDADVLVEPQYIVDKRGFLRGGSVTVTGFPAKYSNFHKMTEEEAEIFEKAANSCPTQQTQKKHFLFF